MWDTIFNTVVSEFSDLSNSAGLWFTAAVGVAVGLGNEATAILATLLALLVMYIIPLLNRRQE